MEYSEKKRFSRKTVLAAIGILKRHKTFTQARLTSFLTDFGPSLYTVVPNDSFSSEKRFSGLMHFVDANPRFENDGDVLEEKLVETASTLLPSDETSNSKTYSWMQEKTNVQPLEWNVQFESALYNDGYVVKDGNIVRTLPVDVNLPETESDLMQRLSMFEFLVAKGHLEQAIDNHAKGNWAAANGQLRTFFEAFTDAMAVYIDPLNKDINSGYDRRTKLASLGILSVSLNEWGHEGKGFLNGLVLRLHPQGAHPGLSDEDDCTFRLHIVLTTASFLIRRLVRNQQ
jgi:hypothetical protein